MSQDDTDSKTTTMLKALIDMTEIKHLVQAMISKSIKWRANDNEEGSLNCGRKSTGISLPLISELNLPLTTIQLKQLNTGEQNDTDNHSECCFTAKKKGKRKE